MVQNMNEESKNTLKAELTRHRVITKKLKAMFLLSPRHWTLE